MLVLSAPIVLAAALGAAAAGLVQTQGAISASRLAVRFDRLDPVEGVKNLFRSERLFAVLRALVLALLVALFSWSVFRGHAADFAASVGNERAVVPVVLALGRKLAWTAALAALALGALDVALTLRAWRERHKMSKDEVRREHREAEGDPQVKAQRRRAHQEALTGSMLNAVKDATVVIVNPTHLANALRYREDEDEAPRVVAQGKGELARRIVEAARAYGVPCVVDVPVARALSELETGDEIPEVLYEAVAEILRELAEPPGEPSRPAMPSRRRATSERYSTRTRFFSALSSSSTSGRAGAPGAGAWPLSRARNFASTSSRVRPPGPRPPPITSSSSR